MTSRLYSACLLVAVAISLSACTVGQTATISSPVGVPDTATPVPDSIPATTPAADPTSTGVFQVKIGDCLNDLDSLMVSEVPIVDCAAPHDLEVFDEFSVTDASWDPVALGNEADDGCTQQFADFIGLRYEESSLDVTSYKPTATSWATGDRLISCMVGDSSAQTTGTLRGTAR